MEERLNRFDQKNTVFVMPVGLTKRFKGNEASFSAILMDSLCLRITQMPRTQDLAFFLQIADKTAALPLAAHAYTE